MQKAETPGRWICLVLNAILISPRQNGPRIRRRDPWEPQKSFPSRHNSNPADPRLHLVIPTQPQHPIKKPLINKVQLRRTCFSIHLKIRERVTNNRKSDKRAQMGQRLENSSKSSRSEWKRIASQTIKSKFSLWVLWQGQRPSSVLHGLWPVISA